MEIEERLIAMGYRVAGTASTGLKALELIDQKRPDLILMDIQIKGDMDGIATAHEIRKKHRLPVIFLTAYSEDATLEKAKLAEPYGYILKPFEQRDLKSNIEIALYRHSSLKAEESLRESQEQLRLITDNIPDSFLFQYTITDGKEEFLLVSSGVERVFPSLKSKEVLNDAAAFLDLIEPDNIIDFHKAVEKSAREMTGFTMDLQERSLDGNPRWFHVHSQPRRTHTGQLVWDGVIIDISDRKQAENRIQSLARQSQLALDAANLGWWAYNPVTRVSTLDKRYQSIFGISEHTIPNDEILQKIIHPDDLPYLWKKVEKALDPISPEPYAAQYRIIRPDGRIRWVEAYGITVFEGNENNRRAANFTGTVADITDRKEAEKALQESEKKNQFLADIIRLGSQPVAVGYPDGRLGMVNHAFEHLTGYSFEELQLIDWANELTPQEWLPMERVKLEELHETGKPVRYEKEYVRKDGTRVPVELFVHLDRDYSGRPEFYYAYITDITDRKQAEKQLIASEKRNRQILHTAMDGYFRADRQGRILEANPAFSQMSGYDIKELLSMNIADIDASREAFDLESQMLKIIASGKARFEFRNRRKDGSVYDVEVSVHTRKENEDIEFVAFLRDITQRKTIERVQEAKLRLIDFASNYSTREFLQELIDEAEALTGSEIGFFHFVEDDQETLSLQTWSTNTLKNMCSAAGSGSHYPISQAGIWVDCVKEQRPLIHNDYAGMKHKKGLPEGHVPIVRELVVPVFRKGKIVAILGLGNKNTDYHEHDIDTVQQLADLSWDTVILKRAEEALRESEEKYRSMMESMNDGAFICSPDFKIEYMNPAMIRQIGRNAMGEICYEAIHGLNQPCSWCSMDSTHRGERTDFEVENPSDGRFYIVSNSPIFHSDGLISQMAIYRDVTQIKNAEKQLRQAQKLEALGTLSAGIAHDFNNILSPITALSELLMEDLPRESFEWDNASGIFKSAMRAADLVKQILSFSRKGEKTRVPTLLHQILQEVCKLIRSTIPSNIPFNQYIQEDCQAVMADPTQLHQVTMNLVTNAYHAVEDTGGEITLELREIDVQANEQPGILIPPGKYAVISVSDTGKGIDPANLDKIFEPYFTTKKEGKGTGLGLSVVYGIVKEHGGDIAVLNEPGKGVRFDVYLPVAGKNTRTDDPALYGKELMPTGNERILLVDDEEAIVGFVKKMLGRLGYQVASFTKSLEALGAFASNPDGFDMVVSDMAMPQMTGVQLAHEMRAIRADIPIIICTGYSERIDEEKAKKIGVNALLMKPLRNNDLARLIRTILDESKSQKHK